MNSSATKQEKGTPANQSSPAASSLRNRRSEIEQELCKIKLYIRGFKTRAREILDEIKIYQKDVPREYWKDMDQLRSALKEIKRELEKLRTLKRRLRYEAKELRKEALRQIVSKLRSWTKLRNVGCGMKPLIGRCEG
ncbi:hypothetical protein NXS19_006163 [Fusarium pseudograminearum]|nr:hypothetical protein NXS19_006163 [Fusarium pseudograminearum]